MSVKVSLSGIYRVVYSGILLQRLTLGSWAHLFKQDYFIFMLRDFDIFSP